MELLRSGYFLDAPNAAALGALKTYPAPAGYSKHDGRSAEPRTLKAGLCFARNGGSWTAVQVFDGATPLRRLQRKTPEGQRSVHVYVSERLAPLSVAGYQRMVARAGVAAGFPFLISSHVLRHSCGYKLANDARTLGRSNRLDRAAHQAGAVYSAVLDGGHSARSGKRAICSRCTRH
jgi:integrase